MATAYGISHVEGPGERFIPRSSVTAFMAFTGITLGSRGGDELIEYASLAEERGMDSMWVGESWGRSAVPLITRLLERTETIDVCSGILNVYSRTPSVIAMTAATLAEVGDDRFRVGLGTSGPAVIEGFHGVEFESPLRRTREYVEIVRGLLQGDRVTYDGQFFELSGFALDVESLPECPIYLAGMGEHNRRLIGEFADGWMPLLIPHTGLADALDAVERGTERGDRSLADVDVVPWVPTCISEDDPEAARDNVKSLISWYVAAMGDYYAAAATDHGFGEEATAIQDGWEDDRLAGAKSAVTNEMIDAFGVAGRPAEAAESVKRFVEAGADSTIAYLPAKWASDALVRETIAHL